MPSARLRLVALVLAIGAASCGLALAATGGMVASVAGLRVSARSPLPAFVLASLLIAAWLAAARRARAVGADLARLESWLRSHDRRLVWTMAIVACAVVIRFHSFSAAGADASGYLSQTALIGGGALERAEPLAAHAAWHDAATTLAPLGWRPAPPPAAAIQVPTYAIGLPLLMTGAHAAAGGLAAALIVPFTFAIAIVAVAALARQVAGPMAALIAATWLATSPVALIEAMQSMSDVPVTAAWLIVWALVGRWSFVVGRRSPVVGRLHDIHERWVVPAAGVAAAFAILIRPNLAPLAAAPALWLWLHDRRGAVIFVLPVAIAGGIVAYLQWRWFGSPLRSGYGTAEEIYALANVAPNARLYFQWLIDAHGPWLLAAPLAALWPGPLRWLLAFAALVCGSYLIYAVFETWTYLRFLLPALAMFMIATAALIVRGMQRVSPAVRIAVVVCAVLAIAATNVAAARRLGVFRFGDQQARALLAGRYLDAAAPPHAVFVAGEQSGSVRYYAGRSVVRWDLLAPEEFDRMLDHLLARGHDPWIVLDDWEEPRFRERFHGAARSALDWPPLVDAGAMPRTRAWRVRDRAAYMNGAGLSIDRLR